MTDFETYPQVKFALEVAKKMGVEVEIVGDKARITIIIYIKYIAI